MHALVIGASGLIGQNLVRELEARDHEVTGTYRTERTDSDQTYLDKTDEAAVADLVADRDPDAVVDTAAFHAVDDCETERRRAFDVNAVGTRHAAAAADDAGAQFLYLSTDYVLPGDPDGAPYDEDAPVAPVNYYAETKYAGERAARVADAATVLRPSVVYGPERENFVTWALGRLRDGETVRIVDDQVHAPTYAPDLARAIADLLEGGRTGLYHATGPESVSRYEFVLELARAFGFDADRVVPISTAELGQDAPRPADSTLDSSRLYETLGYEFRAPATAFEDMRRRAETDE